MDPIGLAGGANLYGFVGGDPANFDDPFGLCVFGIRWCPPRDAHYARNGRNTGLPSSLLAMQRLVASDDKGGWSLAGPRSTIYHRHGYGNAANLKFINVDGREAVYNRWTGALVDDSQNLGTFNFVAPIGIVGRIGHFVPDVLPYWLWGNSPDDNTSGRDRFFGASIQNTWQDVNRWLGEMKSAGVPITVRY